jgi:hypothetical protein
MKTFYNAIRQFIERQKNHWKIVKIDGVIVGYDMTCIYVRREIPFTLYVRNGRKTMAKTQFRILEWAESVCSDRHMSEVLVRLDEDSEGNPACDIKRIDKREIVITTSNPNQLTENERKRMGSSTFTLKLA